MKWIAALLIPAALMASSIDETYERVLDVQQGFLMTHRNDALFELAELYPNHPISERLTDFLETPTSEEETFFTTFTPSDPFEQRVKELFIDHTKLAQASKDHLFKQGLIDIN